MKKIAFSMCYYQAKINETFKSQVTTYIIKKKKHLGLCGIFTNTCIFSLLYSQYIWTNEFKKKKKKSYNLTLSYACRCDRDVPNNSYG